MIKTVRNRVDFTADRQKMLGVISDKIIPAIEVYKVKKKRL
jgi:hypothetical protein